MTTQKGKYFEKNKLPNKYQTVLWVLVIIMALFLSLRNYQSFQIGAYDDDSEYAVLAQSFVQSDTYGLINIPEQSTKTRFPFGYPLIIAPMVALFPNNVDALKIPSLVATILNASLLFWGWRWFSRGLSYWAGLAVTILYLLTPLTIGHTRMVMSEPVFTTFCIASIILIEQALHKPQGFMRTILLSFCLFFTLYTRTVGFVLIVLAILYLLLRRRKNAHTEILIITAEMLILLGIIIAVTPLNIKNALPNNTYINQLISPTQFIDSSYREENSHKDTVWTQVVVGVKEYVLIHVRATVFPLGGGDREKDFVSRLGLDFLPTLFSLTLVGLIVLGYFHWLSVKGISVSLVFSVVYLGIIILWPWRGPRFLYSIQPQLFLGLLLGIGLLLSQAISKLKKETIVYKIILVMFVLGLTSLNIYKNIPIDNSQDHIGDNRLRSSWFRSNSETSVIVMTEHPQTDYLYSHQKTVPVKRYKSLQELENYLLDNDVDYILLASDLYQWQTIYSPIYSPRTIDLLPMLETMALDGRVKLVYSYDPQIVKIFKVLIRENQGG